MLINHFLIVAARIMRESDQFRSLLVPELVVSEKGKNKDPCEVHFTIDGVVHTTILTGWADYGVFCFWHPSDPSKTFPGGST